MYSELVGNESYKENKRNLNKIVQNCSVFSSISLQRPWCKRKGNRANVIGQQHIFVEGHLASTWYSVEKREICITYNKEIE